jgi:hypothetical protein
MEKKLKTIKKGKQVILCLTMSMFVSCTTTNKNVVPNSNQQNKNDNKSPFLTAPKVRKVWIPEKIENDKFIEGHYMWILEKTSSWSQ